MLILVEGGCDLVSRDGDDNLVCDRIHLQRTDVNGDVVVVDEIWFFIIIIAILSEIS